MMTLEVLHSDIYIRKSSSCPYEAQGQLYDDSGGITFIHLHLTSSNYRICKDLSEAFPIQNGLKKDVFHHCCSKFALEDAARKVQRKQSIGTECNISAPDLC
jgi:hypothetical protein